LKTRINQNIENQNIENQNIENQNIENQNIENQNIRNSTIGKTSIEILVIDTQSNENPIINNLINKNMLFHRNY